ncbi:choice-of-anchor V domain-containing protein [Halalkalibaculum sp. DA3122]|uniref:choice-of-anchor V domain-containing protein n=1 Tax=unclassified Halalkalibaculum TaxID=2964617 RepID=UPI0037553120
MHITRITLLPVITLVAGLLLQPNQSNTGTSHTTYHYPEHLTGTFTGGFGEDTCHSCHFDYPLNHDEGLLRVEGFPREYQRGRSYMIRIHVERPDLAKAGFQLSARFPDGRQAGMLSPQSDRTQFTESAPDSLQYLQHSPEGTAITGDISTTWQLKWIAPRQQDDVYIHLAVNAANGDGSEFGDFILTRELTLRPRPE